MYGPDWDEGCPSCSGVADGFDETHLHLQNHDVAFTAVSRAPLDKLLAYRDRMGWSFPWASSGRSDFNFDFNVSFTEESVANGGRRTTSGRSRAGSSTRRTCRSRVRA